jgi:hypothetical protein
MSRNFLTTWMNISFPRTLLHGATQTFTRKISSIIYSLPKAILLVLFLPYFQSRMNVVVHPHRLPSLQNVSLRIINYGSYQSAYEKTELNQHFTKNYVTTQSST